MTTELLQVVAVIDQVVAVPDARREVAVFTGVFGLRGRPGVVAAEPPATYDPVTGTVGVDVGPGAGQVAAGDHNHAGVYDAAGAAAAVGTALDAHTVDTTGVHGIADTSALVVTTDPRMSNARTPTGHAASHAAAGADPVTPAAIGAIPATEKAAASGVATLDGSGKIPTSQLPALAITTNWVVASQAAMLALDAQEGDIAIRSDISKTFILGSGPSTTLGSWHELLSPTDAVSSVDGRTGSVSLSDLYAAAGRSIATSAPLAGGGTLAADRTLSLNLGTGLKVTGSDLVPDFGTGSGKVAQGNDARFTDSRTPTAHKGTHGIGGTDRITPVSIGAAATSGRALPTVMSSPPTVAIGTGGAASTISGAVNLPYTSPLVRFLGGNPAVRYSQTGYYQNATLPDSSGIQNPFAVEFMHDGQYVEWSAKDAGTSAYYRIMVDGQYATAAPQSGRNAADGANYRVKISFASRAVRRIRIELAYMPFGGLDVGPNDTVWLPPAPKRRAMILSDSYGVGSGAAGYVDVFWQSMAQILGWDDPWANAENSTGYLNPGGGGKETFGTRLAATVVPYSPDVLVVWGGMNDTTTVNAAYTTSALGAACTALYTAIASALPNCLLYVIGAPQPSGTVPSPLSGANAAILAAASAHSFVRGVVDPTGWITGTGKVGSTTGSGNADLYTSSDGVHPSPAGHAYLGQRIASALIGLGV